MKFLIVLPYYNRDLSIFKNAIKSIAQMDHKDFELAVINDGSKPEMWDAAYSLTVDSLREHQSKLKFYQINDTPEQKISQGGSRHGEFMNKAILESNADVVIILCDDDVIHPKYFTNLERWFTVNKHKKYCYSHVIPFDPEHENPFEVPIRPHVTNIFGLIHCSNRVDSSQVAYRRSCFTEGGVRYKSPRTRNLDSDMFSQLFDIYGPCHYTGFFSQYKGWFRGQLGCLTDEEVFKR